MISDLTNLHIKVNQHGNLFWIPSVVVKGSCPIDVTAFPFDIQVCSMEIGSWSYPDNQIKINKGVDYISKVSVNNPEWLFVNMTFDIKPYIFGNMTFSRLKIKITMKREPQFYIFNIVVPCILLMFIGSLTFCLPPSSGEKVSLSVTVFLALMVLMMAVMDVIPVSATGLPFLRKYIKLFFDKI